MNYAKHLTEFTAEPRVYGVSHTLFNDEHTKIGFNKLRPGETHPEGKHDDGVEFFYTIKGKGKVYVGEESYQMTENSFVYIPKDNTHSVVNEGDEILSYLYIISYHE